jgi:hypothetical protein
MRPTVRLLMQHETSVKANRAAMRERFARRICTEHCAFKDKPPCWSPYTSRKDAMEWPNPNCKSPGCHAIADGLIEELFGV